MGYQEKRILIDILLHEFHVKKWKNKKRDFMNTENLRELFPMIKEAKVINRSYGDGEDYAVLAMLAKKDDTFHLWEITAMSDQELERKNRIYKSPKTNREELKQNLEEKSRRWIESITIGDCCFEVTSASGTCLGEQWNVEEQLMYLYMLQQGMKLGELEQVSLDRLNINHYELAEKEGQDLSESEVQNMENADVTISLSTYHISVLIQKRFRLKTGEYAKPKVVSLTGEAESKVYIHGISLYDVWEDAEARFEDERYKEQFTEDQISQMKQEYFDMLPQLCPQGCVLPLVEYECDKDYQMQFYTTDYLKRVPKHESAASFWLARSDKKTGPMGYRRRICHLEAVEKGFEGELAVELFACYKMMPANKNLVLEVGK